jgi:pimeloyl-ACP methyl ester carboxylesterase
LYDTLYLLKKVYFISGLGANRRAFDFLDLSFCEPVFIEWIKPLPKETLEHYAVRLKEGITDPNPVVVGVSFGGMLATEMAKRDPSLKAILISSSKTAAEFPAYLRVGKYLPVYKWLPPKMVKAAGRLSKNIVGPKGKEEKKVFMQILKDTDHTFTNWATEAILKWSNKEVPQNVIHIHGDADRLLPYRLVKCNHRIKGGTHLMIFDKAKELSVLLKQLVD